MPRRANDPELLRAQAQAGRDGENAYKMAQNQLANMRQGAVQQAMQEAALRGAPADALGGIRSRVASPYNQAMRSNAQMGAGYSADMAARAGRMDDYNQAVLAARQLIPVQIQQALAPIQAQNRFQLQSLRMQGAQALAQIEAQTALQLAQMRAQERLARIKARQYRQTHKPTLTEGETLAALQAGGLQRIDTANEALGAAIAQGRQQAQAGFRQELGTAKETASQAEQAALLFGTPGANLFEARMALLGQAPSERQPTPQATGTTTTGTPSAAFVGGVSPDAIEARGPVPTPEDLTAAGYPPANVDPRMIPFGPNPNNYPVEQAPLVSTGGLTDQGTLEPPGIYFRRPPSTQPAEFSSTFDMPAFGRYIESQRIGEKAATSAQAAADLAALRKRGPEALSQYGLLTEQQVANLPGFAGQIASNLPRPVMNERDLQELLYGRPTGYNRLGQPTIDPFAAQVKEQAMGAAAQQLVRQGYDINVPAVQNAILSSPGTMWDVEQAKMAQPTSTDIGEQVRTRAAVNKAAASATVKANEATLKGLFQNDFKVPMPTSVGSPTDVADIAYVPDPAGGPMPVPNPDFAAVFQALQNVLKDANYNIDQDEAINKAFEDANVIPSGENFGFRALLKAMAF